MLLGKRSVPDDESTSKTGIVDSQSQAYQKRLQEVMEIFRGETELIPNEGNLPSAQLKLSASLKAYNTASLSNEMYESQTAEDVKLIWTLASQLYKNDKNVSKQRKAVHHWIRDLVKPGLESQLGRWAASRGFDPFHSTFVYLSFGQRDLACEQAQNQKDYDLGMYIVHSESNNLRNVIKGHLAVLQKSPEWQTMSNYHKKCWYTIAGELGYHAKENFVVTERVYWQCTLGMYIWYGDGQGHDQPCSLQNYNNAFDSSGGDIHQLKAIKQTAEPDESCLWYQLLQWWFGNQKAAEVDEWPHDLAWLLYLYKGREDEKYLLKWIDELEKEDLAEWAIYASLFLKSPKQKVDYILRECEWNDEAKLINEFYLPKIRVQIAKALYAHDSWDYETEYTTLVKGGLFQQAKLALLHFLLPKLFQNQEDAIETSIKFINEYPKDKQDEEVKLFETVYTYLSCQEPANEELSKNLIAQLTLMQALYEPRSTNQLLKDLAEAIQVKE